jgi:hypothetical protein
MERKLILNMKQEQTQQTNKTTNNKRRIEYGNRNKHRRIKWTNKTTSSKRSIQQERKQ